MTEQELKDAMEKLKQIKYKPGATFIEKMNARAQFYVDNKIDLTVVALAEIAMLWGALQAVKEHACQQSDTFGELLTAFGKTKDDTNDKTKI